MIARTLSVSSPSGRPIASMARVIHVAKRALVQCPWAEGAPSWPWPLSTPCSAST
jgi:hypothetical protein